ncbi:MAG: MerR family transcriptional regulator [Calditrichaeota bacterium]|nr:MAG: MerR family transcriptional regulator [Calditrichota bacterium]
MTIHELIEKSGQSRRTIYYYIQLGLLPSPRGKGRNFEYTNEHLERLKRIARLQAQRYSLKEIKQILDREAAEPSLTYAREREADYALKSPPAGWGAEVENEEPTGGELWQRFSLAEGIELHVRRPVDPHSLRLAQARWGQIMETLLKGGRR